MYFIHIHNIYKTALFNFVGDSMSSDLSILDHKKALELVSGNAKLADDLLAMLLKELPGYKQTIQKELEANDRDELRKIVHKIHGGLRYIGAPALMAIVSQTDYNLFELDDDQLQKNINQIYHEIDRLIAKKNYIDT